MKRSIRAPHGARRERMREAGLSRTGALVTMRPQPLAAETELAQAVAVRRLGLQDCNGVPNSGYKGNTLIPNKHITRAQMSANNGRTWITVIATAALKIAS
ncbi:MAG TPA: hypothetical protein VFA39_20870 [Steroidobacteraceae bacterium]|nr:hypothetical protein [Steroidobacteraceae bacterium]